MSPFNSNKNLWGSPGADVMKTLCTAQFQIILLISFSKTSPLYCMFYRSHYWDIIKYNLRRIGNSKCPQHHLFHYGVPRYWYWSNCHFDNIRYGKTNHQPALCGENESIATICLASNTAVCVVTEGRKNSPRYPREAQQTATVERVGRQLERHIFMRWERSLFFWDLRFHCCKMCWIFQDRNSCRNLIRLQTNLNLTPSQ